MMKRFQSLYYQLLYLLIAALLECKAQTQRHCSQVHQLNINCFTRDNMSISCLTTSHPLESLTVKLRSITQDKDILKYRDISLAAEHQRWSVRKDAGNVTLDLNDCRLSDDGLYDCKVYKDQDCLHATQFTLKVKECEKINSVQATFNSSVLLQCSKHQLQNMTNQVTWKVVVGHQLIDIAQYRHPNKPSSSTEKLPNPFYQRARQLNNGSLLIRDAVQADELWYQCRVNETTCYEMKLLMKSGSVETPSTTLINTNVSASDDSFEQAENRNESELTNSSVVVMTTVLSLCLLTLLAICVILYLKKRKHKTNSHTQLNDRLSVYYSHVADEFDVPCYSLIEQSTATMTTFGGEQPEASALQTENMYETFTM